MGASSPHIFLFHGNDSYTISKKCAFWKQEFAKKYPSAPIHILDLESWQYDSAELNRYMKVLLEQQTLFAQKKLVIIKYLFSQKEYRDTIGNEFIGGIGALSEHVVAVFVERVLDKRLAITKKLLSLGGKNGCLLEEFAIPQKEAMYRWIERYASQQKASFSNGAIDSFLDRIQSDGEATDLWNISNELDKLAAYARGRAININDLTLLIPHSDQGHVFDLVAALLANDRCGAACVLSLMGSAARRYDKSDMIGICSFLHSQYHDFLIVKDMLLQKTSLQSIASVLSWKSERTYVVSRNLSRISLDTLLSFARTLTTLETALKTSSANPRSILTIALLDFISSRSSCAQHLA